MLTLALSIALLSAVQSGLPSAAFAAEAVAPVEVKLKPLAASATPVLKGILIEKQFDPAAAKTATGLTGVHVKDLPLLDERGLGRALKDLFGKPITKNLRNAVKAQIINDYRRHGRLLVQVYEPPQEITDGVLQIVVLEAKLGQVRAAGNKEYSSAYLTSLVRAVPGGQVDAGTMNDDMDWINRNQYRHVDLVYAKGEKQGTTDLVLQTQERRPFRFFTGYDDSGSKASQEDRFTFGAGWGNVLGHDGQLNYQLNTSPDFRAVRSHSGTLIQPLPWRHMLTLSGSYADSRAIMPSPLDMTGYSWQTSLGYEVPLPSFGDLSHAASAGFDFKRSNNNLTFGGTSVFASALDVAQFNAGYNAAFKDPLGSTSGRLTLTVSPGGLSRFNNNAAFNISRAFSHARYHVFKMGLDRETGLWAGFSLVNMLSAQVSDADLPGSEQIGFGGFDTIRGVDTRVLNTDQGYMIKTELRTPYYPIFKSLGDGWQSLLFVDYGAGSNYLRLQGEVPETKLLTMGFGARYRIAENFSFRFDHGWQLKNEAQAVRPSAARFHVGLTMTY